MAGCDALYVLLSDAADDVMLSFWLLVAGCDAPYAL